MTANFDADNSNNWVEIFTNSYQVNYIQGKITKVYQPIEPQELILNIDSPLIAINCTSTQYPNQKRYLGSIAQQVNIPGFFPTISAMGGTKAIYSNQTILANFTQFDDSYNLLLKPRYYVEQLTVTIYKYIGSVHFVLEEKLNTIEAKIDEIAETVNTVTFNQAIIQQQVGGSVFTNFL